RMVADTCEACSPTMANSSHEESDVERADHNPPNNDGPREGNDNEQEKGVTQEVPNDDELQELARCDKGWRKIVRNFTPS
ncbi:hypothetical protein ACO22_08026, partial [Paracoccidioides brasiliensis]